MRSWNTIQILYGQNLLNVFLLKEKAAIAQTVYDFL